MLHIRRFGSQGESLPLPEWTEDRQRFLEWATLPLKEALPGVALTKAKPSTAEQWIKHCEAVGKTTSHALAWATPTPTGYALGWHNHRVFIEPHAPGGPRVQVHAWHRNRWLSFGPGHKNFLDQLALAFGGEARDKRKTEDLTEFFTNTHCDGITPPWQTDNHFSVLGYDYKHLEGLTDWIQGDLNPTQWSSMERWFTHRFRNMVKSIPELAPLWRMSRVAIHHREYSFAHLLELWRSLRLHSKELSNPLQALLFAASPGRSPGCDVLAHQLVKSGTDWRDSDFFVFPERFVCCVPPFKRHLRTQALALSWPEAFRVIKTAAFVLNSQQSIYNPTHYPSPPAVILELLLTYNQPIPSVEKFLHLMKSPYPLWAWLFLHTPWAKLEHQPAWPNKAAFRTVFPNDTTRRFLNEMVSLRRLHCEHPQRLETVARATVAWITASRKTLLKTRNCEPTSELSSDKQILLQGPHQVIQHLASLDVPVLLFKDLVNKRLKWGGVLSLIQKLQEDRLRLTEDFTAPVGEPDQSSTPVHPDQPWPSAIGNLLLNGHDVHPLCRPSHLEAMGAFLDNCAQSGNQLENLVKKARAGRARFFRIRSTGREFLLQLSSSGNRLAPSWTVCEFRGRSNHEAPKEAWVVARKVAELYTLLAQPLNSSTEPEQLEREGILSNGFPMEEDVLEDDEGNERF